MTLAAGAFILGFALGGFFFRRKAYDTGWKHGERYGVHYGYRQAWLKQHRPLLNADREDWNQ